MDMIVVEVFMVVSSVKARSWEGTRLARWNLQEPSERKRAKEPFGLF
jgi:hypothetical protein